MACGTCASSRNDFRVNIAEPVLDEPTNSAKYRKVEGQRRNREKHTQPQKGQKTKATQETDWEVDQDSGHSKDITGNHDLRHAAGPLVKMISDSSPAISRPLWSGLSSFVLHEFLLHELTLGDIFGTRALD